jgi:hypothetical protein
MMAIPILPILIVGGIVLMAAGRKKRTDVIDDPVDPCHPDMGPPDAPNYTWGTEEKACGRCRYIGERTINGSAIYWCEKYNDGTGGMCVCDSWEPMSEDGEA